MAHIIGNENPNFLQGGSEGDLIEGFGGNDTLRGNGGDDELRGGDGDDWLMGGDDNDVLEGGEGADRLEGGGGMDTLRGGGGNDMVSGIGNVVGEYVDGGSGIDLLTFFGQSHPGFNFSLADPTIPQTVAGATIVNVDRLDFTGSNFADTITGGAYDDRISGADGADTIDGGGGNDTMDGGGTGDVVYGGGGDDVIWQRGGETLIDGGSGVDFMTILYGEAATLDFSDPSVDQNLAGTTIRNVERVHYWGGFGANRITGGAYDDSMDGNGGDDILSGGGGNDSLSGGEGLDELRGGDGDDSLSNHETFNNLGFSLADGGDGVDTFVLGVGNYTGPVTIDLLDSTGAVRNVERIELNGSDGVNNVSGGELNDWLRGGDSGDFFQGRGGDDQINGYGGDDIIHGGAGNDLLEGWAGYDRIYGDEGDDDVRASTGGSYLDGGAGADTLRGYIGVDTLIGGEGDDLIDGSDGNDELRGGAGADRLEGGAGADIFVFGQLSDSTAAAPDRIVDFLSGTDKIDLRELGRVTLAWEAATDPVSGASYQRVTATSPSGSLVLRVDAAGLQSSDFLTIEGATEGDDDLVGTDGDDVIDGLGGHDLIHGLGGNDDLRGGDGNDILHGDAGNDVVSGGYGDDTAYVTGGTTAADTGSDTVDLGFNLAGPGGGQEAGTDHLIVDYSGITEAVQFAGFGPSHGPAGASATIQVGGVDRLSFSGVGRLTLTTGSGGDLVYSIGRDDVISTGAGNDLIHAFDSGAGRHRIDGGTGIDVAFRVDWSDLDVAVVLDLNDPQGVTIGSGAGERYLRGLEAIVGFTTGSGNDVVVLGSDGALNNLVSTGLGSDTVVVFGGATYASTGQVAVNLGTGPGTDELIAAFGASTESIYFQSQYSGGTVTIGGVQRHGYSAVERLFLETGSADDTVDGRDGGIVAFGFSTGAGNDLLYGGALDDQLQGGIGDDRLEGGAGHDRLYGDGGDDQLFGGAGNDVLTVEGPGIATVEGGGDTDTLTIVYEEAASAITMSAPAVDPNGGFAGTIGDGSGHAVTYSGIEKFAVLTGSGNDVVRGGTADDYFSLGAGNDLLHLSGGSDYADGGSGIDGISGTVAGSAAVIWNLVTGTLGTSPSPYSGFEYFESLTTGSGQDSITTANVNANDSLILGAGNDSAILWNGHDTVNGGAAGAGATDSGFDTLILNYGQSTSGVHNVGALASNAAGYSGQFGDDGTRLATFEAIDRFLIATGSGADSIVTGDGNDQIRTAGGNDVVNGGGGNDLIDGGGGDDSMTGGTGDDIYFVSSAGDVVSENSGEGLDEVRTALATYVLAANVEKLTGISATSQDLRGNSGDNVITGSGAADVLRLHDGGNDTVLAGAGNDNIFFIGSLTGADVVNGGEGTDTLILQGPYGSLVLSANVTQIENISLLAGSNIVFGGTGTDRYDYVLTVNDANFAAGVQARINGSALLAGEDFTFDGSAETDALFVVYGGKGRDTLTGGLGNDIFFYAEERFASGDTVNGGVGYDGMFLRGNYTIDFTAPGYTGLFTSIENLTLTSATDERYARGGGTEFDYNLTLSDAIVGAGQVLTVSGALLMASETMVFDASQESDGALRLFGGKASDTLKGGALADLIHGNLGADILTGNGGADAFRYQNVAESNSGSMDQILDFTAGTDKIELDRIDADTLVAGNQAFAWIGSGAFTGTAGQLRAYEQGGTWFVEGDTNGDSVADLVIALTLQGPTPLGAGDFVH